MIAQCMSGRIERRDTEVTLESPSVGQAIEPAEFYYLVIVNTTPALEIWLIKALSV